MSVFALSVSLAHAVPIVITLLTTQNKQAVRFAAAIMALIAIFFGHRGYTAIDSIVVIVAYFGSMEYLENKEKQFKTDTISNSEKSNKHDVGQD